MLLTALLLLAQDYTISGEGREGGGAKATIVLAGKSNLPDGAIVAVTLYRGATELGRKLAGPTHAQVTAGAFTAEFPVFPVKNFPGDYTFDLLFPMTNQQTDVRKKMGSKFREYRGSVAFALGTKEDLEKAIAERRRELASKIDLLDAIAREAQAALVGSARDPKKARWGEWTAAWRARIDGGLEGMDRPDTMLIPGGERTVELLGRLHEDVEGYIDGAGRLLATAKKAETFASFVAASNTLADKLRWARVVAGVVPGLASDVESAIKAMVASLDRAVKEGATDEDRRAYREAAMAAARIVPRPAQWRLAQACAKGSDAVERAARGEREGLRALTDEAWQQAEDCASLSKAYVPK